MAYKKSLALSALLAVFLSTHAQHDIKISYDTSGIMTSFPTQIVRKKDHMTFSVRVPVSTLKAQWNLFNTNLQEAYNYIVNDSTHKANYFCLLDTTILDTWLTSVETLMKNWDTTFCSRPNKDTIDLLPVQAYGESILNHQYEVQILKGKDVLITLPLTASSYNCTSDCIDFISQRIKLESLPCHCTDGRSLDSLTYRLISYDPIQRTAVDWYKSGVANQLGDVTSNVGIAALKKALTSTKPEDLLASVRTIKGLSKWFVSWFWFTGGKLALDPFQQLSDDRKKSYASRTKQLDSLTAIEKERLKFIDSAKTRLRPSEWHLPAFENLQKEYGAIATRIAADSTEKDKLTKAMNNGPFDKAKTATVLNEGKLVMTYWSVVRPQDQFDGASGYQPVYSRPWKLTRVTEIPQNEKPYVIVYNVDASNTTKMSERTSVYDDQPEFTKVLNGLFTSADFSAISGLTGIVNATVSSFNPFTQKNGYVKPPPCKNSLDALPLVQAIAKDLDSGIITYPVKPALFSAYSFSGTKYRTFYQHMIQWNPPFTDSFSIKQIVKKDTSEVIKGYINVGKLRHFQLAAGLVFLTRPVSVTTVDTSGNGFRVNSTNNTAAAVFGFKFYPVASYTRDNSIRPRYPARRFSLFGGFDIQHPLNDLYAGISYDVVPGFAITIGKNYYQRTVYQIQNGQIINTARSFQTGSTFWAATVDPTLFIQLVKLFFK